ncbi:MAG: preprotein translocase subunit YajC [Planctomycetota bacterium]|nr:preprotein translocase subunit YajC [Planctomycetota bacterium]
MSELVLEGASLSASAGSWLLLAQVEGVPADAPVGPGFLDLIPMFALMWIVVYFLMIRPQRKQAREHTEMLAQLNKHDQVRTIGGIIGKVVQVDQDQEMIVLVIDESKNVRMRVTRQSVAAVLSGDQVPAKIKEEDTAR